MHLWCLHDPILSALPLRDGDLVKVNRSTLARGSDEINAVSQPLGGHVQIRSLFCLINTN